MQESLRILLNHIKISKFGRINCKRRTRMPANERKLEDLQRLANAVGQTKPSFKKQKSSVLEIEEVSFKLFVLRSQQFSLGKILHIFRWICFIILPSSKMLF